MTQNGDDVNPRTRPRPCSSSFCRGELRPFYYFDGKVCFDCAPASKNEIRKVFCRRHRARTLAELQERNGREVCNALARMKPEMREIFLEVYGGGATAAELAISSGREASSISRTLKRAVGCFTSAGLPAPSRR